MPPYVKGKKEKPDKWVRDSKPDSIFHAQLMQMQVEAGTKLAAMRAERPHIIIAHSSDLGCILT